MSDAIIGTGILLKAGTGTATSAATRIGAGTDGVVTTTVTATGEAGNRYTMQTTAGVGTSLPLLVTISGTAILVRLGTDVGGALDPAKNTATLVRAAIAALPDVTAAHSGTGATPVTAITGPTAFSGGSMTGGTYVTVAELVSLKPSPLNRNEIDVSTHNGGIEEKLLGMLRQGKITARVNWVPTNATQSNAGTGVLADLLNNTKRSWRITFPPAGVPYWSFAARAQMFELGDTTTDAAMQADIALTIDSSIDMANT